MIAIWVFAGGGTGSVLRWAVAQWAPQPWATVIVNLVGRPVVLRNDAPQGNWITLALEMANGNRDAIGTKLRVTAGGRTQSSIVRGAGSYLSINDRRPHFGIGKATRVERIDIEWPNGEKQTLTDVVANRFVTVKQQ